jgi:hypothetical protein
VGTGGLEPPTSLDRYERTASSPLRGEIPSIFQVLSLSCRRWTNAADDEDSVPGRNRDPGKAPHPATRHGQILDGCFPREEDAVARPTTDLSRVQG